MKFIARLITDRTLEREVQKFAPDLVNAEGVAREYLEAHGRKGDSFSIFDVSPVLVSIVSLVKRPSFGTPVTLIERVKEKENG